MRILAPQHVIRIPETIVLDIALALPVYFLVAIMRISGFMGGSVDQAPLPLLISLVGGLVLVVIPAVQPMLALVMLMLAGRSELAPIWVGVTDVAFLLLLGFLIIVLRKLILHNVGESRIHLNVHPLLLGVGLFSLIYWAQFVTSTYTDYAFEKFVRIAFFVFLAMLITAHVAMNPQARKQFSAIFLVIVGAMSGVALVLAIIQQGLFGINRIVPIGGGPITLGRFTGFAAVICLAIFARNGNKLGLLGFLWFVGITLMNGSRGPLFALLLTVGLLVVPALLVRTVRRRFVKLIFFLWGALLALLAAFAFAYAMGAPFAGRYVLLFTGDRGGASVGIRLDWISQTSEFLRLAPAWGNGIGSWAILTGTPTEVSYPHNMFTELLVENGLFLTTLFVFLLVCAFGAGGKLLLGARDSQQYADAMIGVGLLFFSLVGAQVSGDLFDNRYMWFAIGWIAALWYWEALQRRDNRKVHSGNSI